MEETFKQLIGEVRAPLPPAPGRVERYDSVYVRHGVASLFLAFEPFGRVAARRSDRLTQAGGLGVLCPRPGGRPGPPHESLTVRRVGYDAPRSQAMTDPTAPTARPKTYTEGFRRAAVGLSW